MILLREDKMRSNGKGNRIAVAWNKASVQKGASALALAIAGAEISDRRSWRVLRHFIEILALEVVIGKQSTVQHDAKDTVGAGLLVALAVIEK
jgi:hypothetical protein